MAIPEPALVEIVHAVVEFCASAPEITIVDEYPGESKTLGFGYTQVLDNLSVHKTKEVERFLAEHPQVRFHFTPTYSSWLNRVELWFAKIQRDVIARVLVQTQASCEIC